MKKLTAFLLPLLLLSGLAQADLQVGTKLRVQNVSVNTNPSSQDDVIVVDASGGNRTINLPTPTIAFKGHLTRVIKNDTSTNTVSVTGFGGTYILNSFHSYVEGLNTGTAWTIESAKNGTTQQTFTASQSGNYVRPFGVVQLHFRMVAGGGGGGGATTPSPTDGTTGGNAVFGPVTCTGGPGGKTGGQGGLAGSTTITPTAGWTVFGIDGSAGSPTGANAASAAGGNGGPSPFGSSGRGGFPGGTISGNSAGANSGAGGGGGAFAGGSGGGGGASGSWAEGTVNSPAATIAYNLGAAGAGGTGGGIGGNGGGPLLVIDEIY